MSNDGEVRVRAMKPEDIPLITNSWLMSYRNGYAVRGVPNTLYFRYQHKLMAGLIPQSIVLVLCDARNEDFVLGWTVAQAVNQGGASILILHFVYVKEPFRRKGLARKLVRLLVESEEPDAVMYTHKTKTLVDVQMDKRRAGDEELREWVYNPYLLYQLTPEGWWS